VCDPSLSAIGGGWRSVDVTAEADVEYPTGYFVREWSWTWISRARS
jgi:hypothetical protein